ncbi:MAG TPA: hypothetical protein VH417_16290 [Vicinamibacterales bacterium]|jgi:hypothetical protein
MTTPAESTTASATLASGAAVRPDDQTESTMIVLRNDLHWLRTRLAVAAASAAALVLVSVYWPAANAGAGVKHLPAVAFQTKTLVDAGGRAREHDAQLLLQDGKVIVTPKDTDRAIRVLSVGDVRSISYSHGRDPLWSSPKGPLVVTRPAASGLERIGIGVRRHWIALETGAAVDAADRFVVLQVGEQSVQPILSALQERTGLTPRTAGER